MRTVLAYNRAESMDHGLSPSMLAADMKLKSGQTRCLALDCASLRAALIEVGSLGPLSIRLPGEDRYRWVLVCGKQVTSASRIKHLSLQEISEGDVVDMPLQVEIERMPPEVEQGVAIVLQPERRPRVRGPVRLLGSRGSINMREVKAGQAVVAEEIKVPPGLRLVSDPGEIVFRVEMLPASAQSRAS